MKFLIPLIAHLLGDFIFQSSNMANDKKIILKSFITHCLIYSGFITLSLIWLGPVKNTIFVILIIIISHTVIDYLRIKIQKKHEEYKMLDFTIFVFDQILHIFIIIGSVHFLKSTNNFGKVILDYMLMHISGKQLYNTLLITILYLICLSPTAVFIKKIFILFSFQREEESEIRDDLVKSGYLIGVFERIIILILGFNGQLAAIGFVLAAKSLARFNQLNDKNFAEKYLMGTLMSVIVALACVIIGNSIMIK